MHGRTSRGPAAGAAGRGPREVLYLAPGPEAAAPAEPVLSALDRAGWRVHRVHASGQAMGLLARRPVRVGLIHLPRFDGEAEAAVRGVVEAAGGGTAWVALVERRLLAVERCRRLIRSACYDFHTLPPDPERLAATLGHAHGMAVLHRPEGTAVRGLLVGESEATHRLRVWVAEAAARPEPALIAGEAGAGKARLARALHLLAGGPGRPLVELDAGRIARLGGRAGAALDRARAEATGGTLMLRRIERLPPDVQRELVRWLSGEVEVAARIVCTTRVALRERVLERRFSAELCLVLQGRAVAIPPLRERPADVRPLAHHFLELGRGPGLGGPLGFTRRAMDALLAHDWPGNVRELEARVRMAARATEGRVVPAEALGLAGRPRVPTLAEARLLAERAAVRDALAACGGNVSRAAHMLGISRASLYRLMARHGIE